MSYKLSRIPLKKACSLCDAQLSGTGRKKGFTRVSAKLQQMLANTTFAQFCARAKTDIAIDLANYQVRILQPKLYTISLDECVCALMYFFRHCRKLIK